MQRQTATLKSARALRAALAVGSPRPRLSRAVGPSSPRRYDKRGNPRAAAGRRASCRPCYQQQQRQWPADFYTPPRMLIAETWSGRRILGVAAPQPRVLCSSVVERQRVAAQRATLGPEPGSNNGPAVCRRTSGRVAAACPPCLDVHAVAPGQPPPRVDSKPNQSATLLLREPRRAPLPAALPRRGRGGGGLALLALLARAVAPCWRRLGAQPY